MCNVCKGLHVYKHPIGCALLCISMVVHSLVVHSLVVHSCVQASNWMCTLSGLVHSSVSLRIRALPAMHASTNASIALLYTPLCIIISIVIVSLLLKLQDALRKVVRGVGGLDHADFRAFRNERKVSESRGFIDGDLVEAFLDLSPAHAEKVRGVD